MPWQRYGRGSCQVEGGQMTGGVAECEVVVAPSASSQSIHTTHHQHRQHNIYQRYEIFLIFIVLSMYTSTDKIKIFQGYVKS